MKRLKEGFKQMRIQSLEIIEKSDHFQNRTESKENTNEGRNVNKSGHTFPQRERKKECF